MEAKMDETQQPMRMFMENVAWWPKNQVAFRFHSPLAPTQGNKQPIIDSLHLDDINRFLREHHVTLKSFGEKDVSRPSEEEEPGESLLDEGRELLGKGLKAVGEAVEHLGEGIEELGEKLIEHGEEGESSESTGKEGGREDDDSDLNNPRGKYLFPSPDEPGSTVIAFFNLQPAPGAVAQPKIATAESMQGSYGKHNKDQTDFTVDVVNLINTTPYIPGPSGEQIKLPAASPNWFGGGTDFVHGCPATPPMPLSAGDPCISSGYSHISYLKLSEELQRMDGTGVRVFVLDTIPSPAQIRQASGLANPDGGVARNRLLQDMATGMQSAAAFNDESSLNAEPPAINVYYQNLPDKVVCDPPVPDCDESPRTGKDLYKQLIGFEIPDHGLVVAGIIRDLAPGVMIECVRVLNDYAVGDFATLTQALEAIHIRMSSGDLMNTPVVINLSLVMTPDDMTLAGLGFKIQDYVETTEDLREALHQIIKSVVNRGAVVVAAAGNDSNSIEMPGRQDPRYPAGFAEVVSVAAVTSCGEAAEYSDRATSAEQPNGIATYGGSVATPVPSPTPRTSPPQVAPEPTDCMTGATDIDALIGVYTSPAFPKLAGRRPADPNPPGEYAGDCQDTYQDTNPTLDPRSCWAYWSGTSFSTPIIGALVARIVEGMSASNVPLSSQVIATINAVAVTSENSELGNVGVVGVDHCQQGVVIK